MKKFLKDTPTQVVLWLVFVFFLVVLLTSCSVQPIPTTDVSDGIARFRAKEAFYSTTSGEYIAYGPIKIINADSAYRAGDTVRINLDDYVLYEKVK